MHHGHHFGCPKKRACHIQQSQRVCPSSEACQSLCSSWEDHTVCGSTSATTEWFPSAEFSAQKLFMVCLKRDFSAKKVCQCLCLRGHGFRPDLTIWFFIWPCNFGKLQSLKVQDYWRLCCDSNVNIQFWASWCLVMLQFLDSIKAHSPCSTSKPFACRVV